MPSDSDRRSVAQEQQTEASLQMLNDELALHSSVMRSSSSSTERPQERCCDVNGDDDILNASRDQTLSDCMQALMKKLKTVFTSLWNSVAMKSRSVEQSQGALTMNKDLNQIDQRSDVNEVSVNLL
jgi:hypothetical protein